MNSCSDLGSAALQSQYGGLACQHAGSLPFTGLTLWPLALVALALIVAGLYLRHRGAQA